MTEHAPIRIAIDTLGGDAPPTVLAAGALDAVAMRPCSSVNGVPSAAHEEPVALILFGDVEVLAPMIRGTGHHAVHSPRPLAVDDPLRGALRGDVPSSMRAAVGAVAEGNADAVVSAGSTGALMALSRHLIGTLPGIRRPAIIKTLASARGEFRMLDLGANIDANAAQLHQFARMGVAAAADLQVPTVGLLNIGSEYRKGPRVVRAAARLLDADDGIRYAGFVEPDQLFTGAADVVVADGFAGNIALKAAEGAAAMARYLLARELAGTSPGVALAKALLGERLNRVRDAYNPQKYNGACMLGLASVVVKSHGGADREGFCSAVRQAMRALPAATVAKVAAGI